MKKRLLFLSHSRGKGTLIHGLHFLLLLLASLHVSGQSYYSAEKAYGLKLGHTKPLYHYGSAAPTDPDKLKEIKKNKPRLVPNFVGRRPPISHNADALPKGPDPAWNPFPGRDGRGLVLPTVNVEGISESNSGSSPPDVAGDVGKDYYVEIVNATFFRVYNKQGTAVSSLLSANTIWNQVNQTSFGDPVILYDQEADRWLLTEFAPVNRRRVLLAVSDNGDPRGSWTAYAFQTPQFPDFPKYGIWPEFYLLTTNENGFNFPIYAFNRGDMLAGEDTVRMQRLTTPKLGGVSFEVGQPVDWDGLQRPPAGSPGIVAKLNDDDWGVSSFDAVELYKVFVNWDHSDSSHVDRLTVPTLPYDTDGCQLENTGGFSCIPQPNGQGIDGGEWIITNKAMYRNFADHESFVISFLVDATGDDVGGIRWIEFRKTELEDWHVYQEGTVGSDDGLHRFMCSVGINKQGSIGLAYSVSGPEKFPSLRYTGRHSFDPPGTMTFDEYEFVKGLSSIGYDRFGDYHTMSVDPADESTFWFAGEYIKTGAEWGTRIVAFNLKRDSSDITPVAVITPFSSAGLGNQEPLKISVLNKGLRAAKDFTVAYRFQEGDWLTEDAVLDSLQPDGIYEHTFTTGIDFDTLGTYFLQIATSLDNDDQPGNDTMSFAITKYGHRDAVLEYIEPINPGVVCGQETSGQILLRNNGGDTLRTAIIQIRVNDEFPTAIPWSGQLAFGEETTVNFVIHQILADTSILQVDILAVNGMDDEVPSNNKPSWQIIANADGLPYTLSFRTDNFPAESSWKLFDENNHLLAGDGPFSSAQHTYDYVLCLDPETCYTMYVYDSFGDGLSKGTPPGDFEIHDPDGNLVAKLSKPNFGSETSSQFCHTSNCLLEIMVGVMHASIPDSSGGVVTAEEMNGIGAVQYSLDGINFQASNIFTDLDPGTYQLFATDLAGCRDTAQFTIQACALQASITTVPALGGDVGEIHVNTQGGTAPLLFSLNGGVFVPDSVFTMLEPGKYIVDIMDALGCVLQDTVTISTQVKTISLPDDYYVRVFPNPGDGVFNFEARFESKKIFIPYTVCMPSGEILFHGSLVRYNDLYRDELSLRAYPAGLYYVIINTGNKIAVCRVVKQ